MKILVCGLPGSGKSTYCKNNIGENGLCYDLDALAAAMRFKASHEEDHYPANKLANDLLSAFTTNAAQYSDDVYIIRTAPQIEELRQIQPDKVVICRDRYVKRNISAEQEKDAADRIALIEQHCSANNIPVENSECDPFVGPNNSSPDALLDELEKMARDEKALDPETLPGKSEEDKSMAAFQEFMESIF